MNRIRPFAGAALLSLLLTSLAYADKVEVITPGGNASLAPPTSTGPSEETADTTPRTASSGSSSSGNTYSPAEIDTPPSLQTMHFGSVSLACKVASGATDLVVVNQGLEPLPPGTRIRWQLKNERKRGFFAIIGELRGGETLVADNVLDGSVSADDICTARVI